MGAEGGLTSGMKLGAKIGHSVTNISMSKADHDSKPHLAPKLSSLADSELRSPRATRSVRVGRPNVGSFDAAQREESESALAVKMRIRQHRFYRGKHDLTLKTMARAADFGRIRRSTQIEPYFTCQMRNRRIR